MRRSTLQGARRRRCGPSAIISFTGTSPVPTRRPPPASFPRLSTFRTLTVCCKDTRRFWQKPVGLRVRSPCTDTCWDLGKPRAHTTPALSLWEDETCGCGSLLQQQHAPAGRRRKEMPGGAMARGDKRRFVSCNKHVSVLEESRNPIVRFALRIIAPALLLLYVWAIANTAMAHIKCERSLKIQILSQQRSNGNWVKNVYYFSSYLYSFTARLTICWKSLRHIALFTI